MTSPPISRRNVLYGSIAGGLSVLCDAPWARRFLALATDHASAGAAERAVIAPQEGRIMRQIPSTGESLPAIGLGTWQTFDVGGGETERAPLLEVLRSFIAAGGSVIDSSPMYGRSEEVVGELLTELKPAPEVFIATKVWTRGREAGIRQMETSMRLLGVERLDLMQVHNLLDVDTHLETLRRWKDEGRIRYIGVTHYNESAYPELERVLRRQAVDFVQLNYSLQESAADRRLLPLAADRGLAVLVNRPFAAGGLFRRVRGRPLPPIADELGIRSWAQLFLKWVVGHPAVTCAIPATSDPAHLVDNMGAVQGRLPDGQQRRELARAVENV